ncbi:hypothetical protein [Clostridium sp. C2-6-12]|uniref:hypothetical protein n=1 Tax=Clostridium sp. C2-6-12 TaxID=2698832 RepID=UPI001FAD9AA3|nr:hypothetical protein [Clostridium sp. C2-6-12]
MASINEFPYGSPDSIKFLPFSDQDDKTKKAPVEEFKEFIARDMLNIINENKDNWNDKYTKNETDNKLSALVTSLDYKEHVATFDDLSKTYPNAEDGWTVSVDDNDITYKYNGLKWVPISANSIPLATSEVDGKMSKQDKIDHDDMNNKKHIHENQGILDVITQKLLDMWNAAYSHISDAIKHITSDERTLWNTVTKKLEVTNIKAGDNISIVPDGNNITINSLASSTASDSTLFETAAGTGTAIILTLGELVNGYSKTFIASSDNNGGATTINGKKVFKPVTTVAPTFKAGRAYTIWYNSSGDNGNGCFFIKASASGTATASDVLAGKTISNDNDTDIVGTMSNIGSVNKSLAINESYTISKGYHDGTGKVTQAVATKSAASYNPSTAPQTVEAGQYLTGAQTINPVTGTANTGHVLSGYTFASGNGIGLTGNIPNFYSNWQYSSGVTPANGRLHMYPPKGYYDPAGGSGVYYDDANFVPENIVKGKTMFGMSGNANRVVTDVFKDFHFGSWYYNNNLPFTPRVVTVTVTTSKGTYVWVWVAPNRQSYYYPSNSCYASITSTDIVVTGTSVRVNINLIENNTLVIADLNFVAFE